MIPTKALEAANRTEAQIRAIYVPRTDQSEPVVAADMANLFQEAMNLRLEIDSNERQLQVSWPRPGQPYNKERMDVANPQDENPGDNEVLFARTPWVYRKVDFHRAADDRGPRYITLAKASVYVRGVGW